MASVVESCNIALSHIRARSINSLNESSIEAQQCKLHYESVRDIVLRDTDWPMARKTVALALLVSTPLRWAYAYQYPTDALAIRMVTGDWAFKDNSQGDLVTRVRYQDMIPQPEPGVPFDIENLDDARVIVTDQPQAYGVYTKKVTNFNIFDPLFIEAFEWLLASRIAIPLIGGDMGRKMREEALGMYSSALRSAIAAAKNEGKRPPRREPSLIEARR